MPLAGANGIEICYEETGDPAGRPLLLIMGLGGQLIHWPEELVAGFAARGFRVITFDNRDVGLSTHLDGARADVLGVLASRGSGAPPDVPYLLTDMAADTAGLLDHLGIDRTHVVGVSLGGMVAQTLAIEHPDRVATLTSVMSSTGDPDVGLPTADALNVLMAPPVTTREQYVEATVRNTHVYGSPGLVDEDRIRRLSVLAWERSHDPDGAARQLAGVLASGSRSEGLRRLAVPTLVVHGTADTLVQPDGGERTAEVVPDAKLLMIEGMGHDLPPAMLPRVIDAVTAHADAHP
ncbi:MAG TPA: alpha/beta hydrolase [Acidimicrobiales bacterium]|nr:alpha/beta hydrolase [Acidimicrobiales bacterium]